MSELKDTEYRVEKSTTHIKEGVYVKVVSTDDDYVTLKTTGVGPDEIDIPREYFENYVESGHLVEAEYNPEMHD